MKPIARVCLACLVTLGALLEGRGSALADRLAFEPVAPGYGNAVTFQIALGDLDGDGDLDAVFANQGVTPSRILLNDGRGAFTYTDQRLTPQGHGAALGDLDNDGDLDLVICCASLGGPGRPSRVYLNDGHAMYTDTDQQLGDATLSGNLVQLADVDGDEDLDVFIAFLTTPGRTFVSRVYLNDGFGAFTESDYSFPFGTLFRDLDGDGDVDAFAKIPGFGYRMLANQGQGEFAEVWQLADSGVQYEPSSFAFGDLDEDGDVDIIDTNGSWGVRGPVYVLFNDGTGAFSRQPLNVGSVLAACPVLADLDGDGHLDASVTQMGEPDVVWIGDGRGGFADSGLRLGGSLMTAGHGVGDLDGDGDSDLFIPIYGMVGGPAVVWLNQTP